MAADPPDSPPPSTPAPPPAPDSRPAEPRGVWSVCPVCGGPLEEIRGKLQCSRCHTICEDCCEGGR